jgi:hypothetical protein
VRRRVEAPAAVRQAHYFCVLSDAAVSRVLIMSNARVSAAFGRARGAACRSQASQSTEELAVNCRRDRPHALVAFVAAHGVAGRHRAKTVGAAGSRWLVVSLGVTLRPDPVLFPAERGELTMTELHAQEYSTARNLSELPHGHRVGSRGLS